MPRFFLLTLLLVSCGRERTELHVFAAASLTDALSEAAEVYRRETGEEVVFNFAASSTLARQIDAGAPADLFLSADERRMDWLAERGRIDPTSRVSLLSNRLVIVVPSDLPAKPVDLSRLERIALAESSTVPAGVYARMWLESVGLWERVAPKVIPAENVRAALHAVETGNADAAIVYATDAAISRRVRVAHEIEDGPPISYPAAIIVDTQRDDKARQFLAWLQSGSASEIFEKHGFKIQNPKSKIQNGK